MEMEMGPNNQAQKDQSRARFSLGLFGQRKEMNM